MNQQKPSKTLKILIILAMIGIVYLLFVSFFGKKKPPALPVPIVSVQKPQLLEMIEYVTQTGTTVAFNAVNLVARVEGYLNAIEFTDGTYVKKGKELFVIQPEPYWEQLKAAEATVAANKAGYEYAKLEYARQQRMFKENATSQNNVEKWLAKTQESKAELDKATANATSAAITYSYTHIYAPFDGRIGRHLVDAGNLVGNGAATNLATIEQIDKLYVYFNLNELDLLKMRALARARGMKSKDINKIPVYVNFQNDTGAPYKATLDFVNTGLNAATGTMEIRAVLENKNHMFLPGLFVQVQVAVSDPTKQLTVPSAAILYDQIGAYLYIVDKDNLVVQKHVTLGVAQNGNQAVTKGLGADEQVIIDGLQYVSAGNKVEIKK